ncbi:SDR family NAD(P)-dependent oxidoreductase [Chitinophaga sp. Cy-1792]|uniref:SDR family NAD(P)-dependent oxidoreductase n=1 Tax=Chitinophaga sp. Cy-1792 TaxID=2608339 RepID=UPI00142307B3|nr:SDR family NAD(P)-dependent oxidoreductase [Chitinophaga sp. Cy-1792]NIG54687.1 SDR family NAD(P)-dependent oxidoreductase [Chitinophaga sp. Cy-1792]
MNSTQVWFITGASKGIGLLLTRLLLQEGYCVAAASRNLQQLISAVGEDASERFLPIFLDITDSDAVTEAINRTVAHFGGLDIVVNNAGFAFVGSMEELTDQEFRRAMDVNLFGTANVIRAAMAHLRKQRSGHIINIASAGGYVAVGNIGSYAASKFGMVGLTEALAQEVAPFGVRATVVLPGSFRTNFLEEGSLTYTRHPIGEYESYKVLQGMSARAGTQPGDPGKLVAALVRLSHMENPPVHLILGPDAYKMIMDKREQDLKEFEAYKSITMSTNL